MAKTNQAPETISISNPNGEPSVFKLSNAMKEHWKEYWNHCPTILDQINGGMYDRWFKGKSNMACLDFGANVGLVSLYMAQNSKRVISVEPTPEHYSLLEWNAKQSNSLTLGTIAPIRAALADSEKMVDFASGHATENKIGTHGQNQIKVEAYPLEWFVGETIIDFCKVDIEGYEIYALSQEQIEAVAGKVKVFFVEMHPYENWGFENMPQELKSRFEKAGYKVELLDFQTLIAEWQ